MTPTRHTTQIFNQKVVHSMLVTLMVLAILYCVILLSLVFSVIERKQNIIATKDLSSQISALETRYSNQVNSINDNILAAHDFSHIDNTTFAVRKDPIASFSVLYSH